MLAIRQLEDLASKAGRYNSIPALVEMVPGLAFMLRRKSMRGLAAAIKRNPNVAVRFDLRNAEPATGKLHIDPTLIEPAAQIRLAEKQQALEQGEIRRAPSIEVLQLEMIARQLEGELSEFEATRLGVAGAPFTAHAIQKAIRDGRIKIGVRNGNGIRLLSLIEVLPLICANNLDVTMGYEIAHPVTGEVIDYRQTTQHAVVARAKREFVMDGVVRLDRGKRLLVYTQEWLKLSMQPELGEDWLGRPPVIGWIDTTSGWGRGFVIYVTARCLNIGTEGWITCEAVEEAGNDHIIPVGKVIAGIVFESTSGAAGIIGRQSTTHRQRSIILHGTRYERNVVAA